MQRASLKLLFRVFVLFWADQVSKLFIRELIDPFQSVQLLPFLHIEYIRNQGIAFGMLEGHAVAIIIVSSLVVGLLALAAMVVRHEPRWTWPFALLGAGSIGNLVDRVWFGSVTDFIRFPHWPAFNLADVFIVTGVLLLIRALVWQPEAPREEGLWYESNESEWSEGEGESWSSEDEWGKMATARAEVDKVADSRIL